jgi:Fic family protein
MAVYARKLTGGEMSELGWAELVWAGDHDGAVLKRAVDRGNLVRLGTGIYTGDVTVEPSLVVKRCLWRILAHELPGAVIVGRSARAGGIAVDGILTVTHGRRLPLALIGTTIRPLAGPGQLDGDMLLPDGIFLASESRTILESLAKPGPPRLSVGEVEIWIDELCARGGERRLNAIRDLARQIAPSLRTRGAFDRLRRLITATLATADAGEPRTAELSARATGTPFDQERLRRFGLLVDHLRSTAPRSLPDLPSDGHRRATLPFYEAYFSNFIEGTEFTLQEAERIVFGGEVPDARPADAHDVAGTYAMVGDPLKRREVAASGDAFIDILLRQHAAVMGGRPDKRPGEFKHIVNRAGSSEFVAPELVEGTLRRAFDIGRGLLDPFQRAAYLMFVVVDVHPFLDGNGRVARIAMNAELTAGGQVRLIIPTVFRLNYIASLKAATHSDAFGPFLAVLDFAQTYTARIDFSTLASAEADLSRTQALRDPYEAEQAGIRLQLP